MPGPKVPVIVTGNGLPAEGRRWSGYKTAAIELGLDRSQSERHKDRQALKEGRTLSIKGYQIRRGV